MEMQGGADQTKAARRVKGEAVHKCFQASHGVNIRQDQNDETVDSELLTRRSYNDINRGRTGQTGFTPIKQWQGQPQDSKPGTYLDSGVYK